MFFNRQYQFLILTFTNLGIFRRFTYLASVSINNGVIYTDNASIQGLSGGPLVLPQNVGNGVLTTIYDTHGVFGVISGTFCDNTGGKLGAVILIQWT